MIGRPDERVTVAESMTAFYGDAGLMRRLLRVEGRGTKWDEIADGVLGRAARPGERLPGRHGRRRLPSSSQAMSRARP